MRRVVKSNTGNISKNYQRSFVIISRTIRLIRVGAGWEGTFIQIQTYKSWTPIQSNVPFPLNCNIYLNINDQKAGILS